MIQEPARVVVDSEGLGTTPERAKNEYSITSDIMFLRGDGWTLGAPTVFENVAYTMWQREWTHFARTNDTDWQPISKYSR